MTTNPIVQITSLEKTFKGVRALDRISCDIHAGHIVGIVGPNSGGKSTLLRHIIGMYQPTQGSCTTFGVASTKMNPDQLSQIGYVHQEAELMAWMSCREIIQYVSSHYQNWNKDLETKLVNQFQLDPSKKVAHMSPGQRQKLSILLATCFNPKLLILDEPAAALDPIARQQFLELLLDLLEDPTRTILISSHILNDIEKVIDHLLVLKDGQLLRDCSFDDLREEYTRLEFRSLNQPLPESWPFRNVYHCEHHGNQAMLVLKTPEMSLEELKDKFQCQVIQHPLSFEEIYPLILNERV